MAPVIQSFKRVIPMVYAYNTPGVGYNDGWTKIGYTEKQTVEERIRQQTHTAGIRAVLAWKDNAMYKDGSGQYFTDHDFHAYLETEAHAARRRGTEWFKLDGVTSQRYFNTFAMREGIDSSSEHAVYELRAEQERAVEQTAAYFAKGGKEFLWNAKPRFGKTLSAYDLVRRMGAQKVLIVTNRPSISNSWAEDFRKFIGWQTELRFVSDTDALQGKPGVISREEYVSLICSQEEGKESGMVAFESLQGLKGAIYFGGKFDKLRWIAESEFDLLIVDEAQEGVDTFRTDRAFDRIRRKHTLYLSGTPFKQLASDQFAEEQIFNWSYADEQEAKENWQGDGYNPYEPLPRLAMFTYQLSPMVQERIEKGLDLSDEDTVDYAFDLNEFFATDEQGRFEHEEEIKKFLTALSTQEKYPFSTPELRDELMHTMWFLARVASAKALAKLLKEDPVFCEYEVIVAAGDGREKDDDEVAGKALDRVRKAIAEHDKTITLTVGQLTVGITVPEWSGVLMLCNLKSASSYMQAAFRAQNPCIVTREGKRLRKETAYVFDFDPARTLIIFDEFANNLSKRTVDGRGTESDHKENIKRLLNFFPVLGEDDEGKMVELDAAQVLSIPRKLKCKEVVRRGFMSNFLFANITNIFGAPRFVLDVIGKIDPAQEERLKKAEEPDLGAITDVTVDEKGNAVVPNEIVIGKTQELFGDKIFETVPVGVEKTLSEIGTSRDIDAVERQLKELKKAAVGEINSSVVAPAAEEYGITKGAQKRLERSVEQDVGVKLEKLSDDYQRQARIAKADLERKRREAETEEELAKAETDYNGTIGAALAALAEAVKNTVKETIENKPQDIIRDLEEKKAEDAKHKGEEEVRKHLRGFARTIPSFIMAYGTENLRLSNFEENIEDDVFREVTNLTKEEFRFLRDGADKFNPETGETEHFDGNLFDEVVFNDSIVEFMKKRQELADYFDESHDEDIFDYIPPQRNNQIYTPRWVVKKMVDLLEENNPGCFDDPAATFADLYMKSGLYITEIVKRLYRSEKIKAAFPDDKMRIRHILREQVFGMAPTRIIYLIATNYIFGFDPELKGETKNFVQADAADAAKRGTLKRLVDESFGK